MTHFSKGFCLIVYVGLINTLKGAPKQSTSTAIAEVHVILAMVGFYVPACLNTQVVPYDSQGNTARVTTNQSLDYSA